MGNQKAHQSLGITFGDFGKVNNKGFVRGVARIAYAGDNRNGSHISKKAFEDAEESLYGIPIVGNWLGDNYGGHDLILKTEGNKVTLEDNTSAFGFVPHDANPRWEEVEDEYGNSKLYYTADVILWYERYQEQIQFIIDNGSNQSMEIMVEDGDFDDNVFVIEDFYYSALCILGRDKDNPENDVEPCFEDSEIIVNEFSFNNGIKHQITDMLNEFKKGGKTDMDNLKDKYSKLELKYEQLEEEYEELQEKYDLLEVDFEESKVSLEKANETIKELETYKEEVEAEKEKMEIDNVMDEYSLLLDKEVIEENINREEMNLGEIKTKLSELVVEASFEKIKKENVVFKNDNPSPIDVKNKYNM